MNFKFNHKNAFFFEKMLQKLGGFCAVILGIFISCIFHEKIQALPYNPSLSQQTENSSMNLPLLQNNPFSDHGSFASHLETDLQKQIAYYDALIEQAKTFKSHWNNTGSLSSLHCYNAIIQKIEMINKLLKKMGRTTLPNLPLLALDQAEEIFEMLDDDL
ncbi:MAG: hypothetical protein JSS34_07150 [Proteobacteria bacterium]|nr:hypothetical protein [Pseudomonadota bacterium]